MKNYRIKIFILMAVLPVAVHAAGPGREKMTPEWVKDLVIYEIPVKSYTSPGGLGTGNFASLKEKVPYLAGLGINGVWLSGHSWSDATHFYNIWTQYACIRPDVLDPSLGTGEEFGEMIDEFHRHGIRVFLDIITHGVMSYSPLVYEKPHWFKGSTWGMADYDWFGGHEDLDQWWVRTHTDYVTRYGVDGYRLDVEIYRPDLWWRIKENAAAAGHPIAVFNEHGALTDNVADFFQLSTSMYDIYATHRMDSTVSLPYDAAAHFEGFTPPQESFGIHSVRVFYTDGTDDLGMADCSEGGLSYTVRPGPMEGAPWRITVSGIDRTKAVKSVAAYSARYHKAFALDGVQDLNHFPLALSGMEEITVELEPFVFDRVYHTSQLTSHDRGWETFPPDWNPYLVQGSRCLMGYGSLFTPSIPIFMAGEEFDAEFTPLPMLSYYMYEKKMIGEGRWLYGSWIQWDQLERGRHAGMLADTRRMLAIRRQESDLIYAAMTDQVPNIEKVGYRCSANIPVPYVLWNDAKALVIVGNDTDRDVTVSITLPADRGGLAAAGKVKVTDLWNGWEKTVDMSRTRELDIKVRRDRTPGGGLSVLRLEAVE